MLKIQRSANGDVVFTVTSRLDPGNAGELFALLVRPCEGRGILLPRLG